jgi:putative membrane protein
MSDPDVDPRFTLANERTLLAWSRTGLAFVAAGLAVVQLLERFEVPGGRRLIGFSLIILGAFIAGAAGRQWQQRESAIRHGRPIPRSRLPWLVTGAVVGVSIVALAFAATGAAR